MAGHSVNGGQGHWDVVAYRACPGTEFDPGDGRTIDNAPWVDASGATTPLVTMSPGPGHCGWQSTTWLRFGNRLYLRDPLGILSNETVGPYLPQASLPADARATGFRSRERSLFIDGTGQFVWIETGQAVERWPMASAELGCA